MAFASSSMVLEDGQSSSESDSAAQDSHGDHDYAPEESPKAKRSRWSTNTPKKWKKNKRKAANAKGVKHIDSTGKLKGAKTPKPAQCRCTFNCVDRFTADERKDICSNYWKLGNYQRQKDYLLSRIKQVPVANDRARGERKRKKRLFNNNYSFRKGEIDVIVCRDYFERTLCISTGPIKTAVKGMSASGSFDGSDHRGKHVPHNKTTDEDEGLVKAHIESFPVVDSHYTRKDTNCQYLDPSLSITKMYELYTTRCAETDPPMSPLSSSMYRQIFSTQYNLTFHHPKKDLCSKCTQFKGMSEKEKEACMEDYQQHIKHKDEAEAAKSADKDRATTDKSFMSATFDLQSVLQIPSSPVSLMYYSRKICVYNLCFYSAAHPNQGSCFCWSEIEGRRGSNEIATCIEKWLRELPSTVREVSLFSDACGVQNRNQNVSAMLLHAVQNTHIECITHTFLESGHTYMECDSMHAAIEHEKKHTDVFSMIDWVAIFRRSRRKKPYEVINLLHGDFQDYQKSASELIPNRNIDENGDSVNWLLVKFKYEKALPGVMQYRYSYSGTYKRVTAARPEAFKCTIRKAYRRRLPLSKVKKADLLKLYRKAVIPAELHPWYRTLPTTSK